MKYSLLNGNFSARNLLAVGHGLFAFSIPFSRSINNVGMGILILCSAAAMIGTKRSMPGLFLSTATTMVLALAIITLDSITPVGEAFEFLQKFLPVVLFPFLMLMTRHEFQDGKIREVALWSFTVSVSLMAVYCLVIGMFNFLFREPSLDAANEDYINRILSSWNYLSYERLAAPSGLHPAYFSLFLSLAIFFLLHAKRLYKVRTALIFLLSLTIFLLAARTGMIAFAIAFVIYVRIRKRNDRNIDWKKYWAGGILLLILFFGIFFINDVFRKRVTDSFSFHQRDEGSNKWNALDMRLVIWDCNLRIAGENWLQGVGFDEQIRNRCYANYSFFPSYGTGFNAHNQFLEFLVVGGVGLLFLLVLYFSLAAYQAYLTKDTMLVVFLTLVFVNLMTECMLSRIKGAMFISYFLALCYYTVVRGTRGNTNQPLNIL